MANRPVLLNLDTLVVRPLVTIDHVDYEMLSPGELSILDLHRFGALGTEFQGVAASVQSDSDLTPAQINMVSATLDRMVRMILRAPEEVLSRLTDMHRYAVVQAFNSLTPNRPTAPSVSTPAAESEEAAEAGSPTGEKS